MAFFDKQTFLAGFNNPLGFAKVFTVLTPAASDIAAVHAAHLASGANTFPGPITNPDKPRNAVVDFSAGWDGGNVTVNGTDQFNAVINEVFTAVPATTVVGAKIFKTVTSITKATVGTTGSASVGTGDKLGFAGKLVDAVNAALLVDNAAEGATLDVTNNGFLPTTVPDGLVSYLLLANVKE